VSQSSEFCHHNTLSYFSTSVYCCYWLFRYRLSPEILDTPSYLRRSCTSLFLAKVGPHWATEQLQCGRTCSSLLTEEAVHQKKFLSLRKEIYSQMFALLPLSFCRNICVSLSSCRRFMIRSVSYLSINGMVSRFSSSACRDRPAT